MPEAFEVPPEEEWPIAAFLRWVGSERGVELPCWSWELFIPEWLGHDRHRVYLRDELKKRITVMCKLRVPSRGAADFSTFSFIPTATGLVWRVALLRVPGPDNVRLAWQHLRQWCDACEVELNLALVLERAVPCQACKGSGRYVDTPGSWPGASSTLMCPRCSGRGNA